MKIDQYMKFAFIDYLDLSTLWVEIVMDENQQLLLCLHRVNMNAKRCNFCKLHIVL